MPYSSIWVFRLNHNEGGKPKLLNASQIILYVCSCVDGAIAFSERLHGSRSTLQTLLESFPLQYQQWGIGAAAVTNLLEIIITFLALQKSIST